MTKNAKLNKENVEDIIGLSPLQEGMLFHYLNDPESEQYLEQLSLSLSGQLDVPLFRKAWEQVMQQNEMLRTVFRWEKLSKPIQVIQRQVDLPFTEADFSEQNDATARALLEEFKAQERKHKIDISAQPFKITLCKLAEDRYELVITNHHIVYDGWSNSVILKEFFDSYNSLANGVEWQPKPKHKFKEFIKWVHNRDQAAQSSYWQRYLDGFLRKTPMPYDSDNTGGYRKVENCTFTFPPDEAAVLQAFVKEHQVTIAALLYSAWGVLLQKYNHVEDVVFGTAVSGRSPEIKGIEDMVGLFINTLPLRVQSAPETTFLDVLQNVNADLIEREEHMSTPLRDIQALMNTEGAQLFDAIMVVENYPLDNILKQDENRLNVHSFDIHEMTSFDLSVQVLLLEGIDIIIQYNTTVFSPDTIRNLLNYLVEVVRQGVAQPGLRIVDLNLVSAPDITQRIALFNQDLHVGPFAEIKAHTLQELLAHSFAAYPERTALEFSEQKISYAELDERSERVAAFLQAKGLSKGAFVGILMEDRVEMIVNILGILKAGCVFVPLDPAYPAERIKTMLRTTETSLVLVDEQQAGLLSDAILNEEQPVQAIVISQQDLRECTSRSAIAYDPDDAIYVFFTSGSTGTPKAVVGRNESLLHFVTWEIETFGVTQEFRVSQFTSPCHNPLLRDLFVPLCTGGTICMPDSKEMMLDSQRMMNWLQAHRVNLIHCTNSLFKIISNNKLTADSYPDLKYVLLAGERVVPKDLVRWYEAVGDRVQLVSLYGQTETTLAKMHYLIKPEDRRKENIPIGKPITGTQVAILEHNDKMCPTGFKGEIHIRTPYRSHGYFKNAQMNQEKFIINPFNDDPQDIVYRTGDLGRVLADGNVEFVGRVDRQIKIRGFRIELNEVENHLLQHEKVKEAAVVAKEIERGETFLSAYVVAYANETVSTEEIRQFLAAKLPDYMVPQHILAIDKMPMNLNGKLDYKALPEPVQQAYEEPLDEIESKLAALWSQILRVEKVGRKDKFLEMGGHSLNVMSLIFGVNQEFGVELPLSEVFKNITVEELALFIKQAGGLSDEAIPTVAERECYPLSSPQMRMFIQHQMQSSSTFYNIPYVMTVEGKLDKERLRRSFEALIERHESLRTSFDYADGIPVQRIQATVSFSIEEMALEGSIEARIHSFIRPFDLKQAPLLRVGLVQVEAEKHMLFFDIHHIISDGMSMTILVRDLIKLYQGERLEPLRIQYKDYSQWQINQTEHKANEAQEQYWLRQLAGELPRLELPIDFPRLATQNFAGRVLRMRLSNELVSDLHALARERECTLYMVLLTAYHVFLHKYTRQEDIIVGSSIAGRGRAELEPLIGMFVNMLSIRQHPQPEKTFAEFLLETKENVLQAYTHQDYPFEELVDRLQIQRDLGRHPVFETMFELQSMEKGSILLEDLTFTPHEFERSTSKFDLSLEVSEEDGEMMVDFEYAQALFKAETVQKMAEYFCDLLQAIVQNPTEKIGSLKEPERVAVKAVQDMEFGSFNF